MHNANQSLLLRKVNRVIVPAREVQEASNALNVYERLDALQFDDGNTLLLAHKILRENNSTDLLRQ